jgi:hypothetical protein
MLIGEKTKIHVSFDVTPHRLLYVYPLFSEVTCLHFRIKGFTYDSEKNSVCRKQKKYSFSPKRQYQFINRHGVNLRTILSAPTPPSEPKVLHRSKIMQEAIRPVQ